MMPAATIKQLVSSQLRMLADYGWTPDNLCGFGKEPTWPASFQRDLSYFLRHADMRCSDNVITLLAEGFLFDDVPAVFNITFSFHGPRKVMVISGIGGRIGGVSEEVWRSQGICQFQQAVQNIDARFNLRPRIEPHKRRPPPLKSLGMRK